MVLIKEIWITLLNLTVGSRVENILWLRVKTLKGVSMLNDGWGLIAFNRGLPLHTIGLTNSIDSNLWH